MTPDPMKQPKDPEALATLEEEFFARHDFEEGDFIFDVINKDEKDQGDRLLDLEIREKASDIANREKYASLVFVLCTICIFISFGIVFLKGFGWQGFTLSDEVIRDVMAATTVQILGLLYVVVRYLFPNRGKKE